MMKIHVAQIRQAIGERQSFRFLCPVRAVCSDVDHLWLDGDVNVSGEVVYDGSSFVVKGLIRGAAKLICNRCLNEFDYPVEIYFSESYKQAEPGKREEYAYDNFRFYNDEIDIAESVRENLLLAEPLKALCSEDCLGICPHCGADRNISPCSCGKDSIDPRLAVLQKFLNHNG